MGRKTSNRISVAFDGSGTIEIGVAAGYACYPALSEFGDAWAFSYPDMSFYTCGKRTHEFLFPETLRRDTNILTMILDRTNGIIRISLNNVMAKEVIRDEKICEPYLLQLCTTIEGQGKVKLLNTRNTWVPRRALLFQVKYGAGSVVNQISANLIRELGYFL